MTETYLDHFIDAHKASYRVALSELELGLKTTHWMWFIFPRASGLGRSEMAKFYAIEKLKEAIAFARHEYLGENYCNCLRAILSHRDTPIEDILGEVDARNLKSSITLFKRTGLEGELLTLIGEVSEHFFYGDDCQYTLKLNLE